jgi:hypothetical protein
VIAEKPYGPNISVTKLECIGYVQKRMGVRLRRLVKERTGQNCMTANLLEAKVDKLQNYNGLAIRRHVNNWKP